MRHADRGWLWGATTPLIALTLLLGACAGGAAEPATSSTPAATDDTPPEGVASPTTASDPGTDVPPAAPGEAVMVVEGKTLTYTFNEYSICNLDTDGFSFGVDPANGGPGRIAGGGGLSQRGWEGTIYAVITTGTNDEVFAGQYEALLLGEGRTLVVGGNRLTYAGPIDFKLPDPQGGNPTLRPAGEGTIAVTCP